MTQDDGIAVKPAGSTDREPPLPPITEHREPVEQGGALYHRCEGCGRETIYGADRIVPPEGYPRRDA